MAVPISPDLVKTVHKCYKSLGSYRKVAALFDKHYTTIANIIRNYDSVTGKPYVQKKQGAKRKTTEFEDLVVGAYVKHNHTATAKEVLDDLKDLHLLGDVSTSLITRRIREKNIRRKNRNTLDEQEAIEKGDELEFANLLARLEGEANNPTKVVSSEEAQLHSTSHKSGTKERGRRKRCVASSSCEDTQATNLLTLPQKEESEMAAPVKAISGTTDNTAAEDTRWKTCSFDEKKAELLRKAYDLSTAPDTEVLVLISSSRGISSFSSKKLQPVLTSDAGKALIRSCLDSTSPDSAETSSGEVR